MTIKKLLELGFDFEFVSIEESGGKPFIYFTNDFLISEPFDLDYELNDKKSAVFFILGKGEVDLKVSILEGTQDLSDEVVEHFSKGIKIMNEGTKR